MRRIGKMAEAAWLLGMALCALGVVLCTKASFGLSMMAAPSYILHVAISKFLPWYTQGTSEYIWQLFLTVLLCIVIGKCKLRFLLSFAAALIFGFFIDGWLWVLGGNGVFATMTERILGFVLGELVTAFAVAFLFRTYLPVPIADGLVVELARHFEIPQGKVKLINDFSYLVLSFALALLLTGGLNGVGIGTVLITLVNAPLIRLFGKLLDQCFEFSPVFPGVYRWLQ